jgi:oxygen-independent coproporphyrinogen III oxidase
MPFWQCLKLMTSPNGTSLYIHIPFCLKKCAYCDFCSYTDLSLVNPYLEALKKEIKLYSLPNKYSIINTVYMGGGTPSLLSPEKVSDLTAVIRDNYRLADGFEFTLEANPETLTEQKLRAYKAIGVKRLSIGVQSFQDKFLKYLGRIHSAQTGREAVAMAVKIFNNVSLDLMYCHPEQNEVELRSDLAEAIAAKPQHISCYELTFNPDTPLYADRRRQSEQDREYFQTIQKTLAEAGYEQYEISNYAPPGFESRHNLAYWSDQAYLGFGVSAHSYDPEAGLRWSNTENLDDYLQGKYLAEKEPARPIERIMLGLRTKYGIPETWLSEDKITELLRRGLIKKENQHIILTEEGILFADKINLELL